MKMNKKILCVHTNNEKNDEKMFMKKIETKKKYEIKKIENFNQSPFIPVISVANSLTKFFTES